MQQKVQTGMQSVTCPFCNIYNTEHYQYCWSTIKGCGSPVVVKLYRILEHQRAKSVSMASYMIICHNMVLVYCNQSKYWLWNDIVWSIKEAIGFWDFAFCVARSGKTPVRGYLPRERITEMVDSVLREWCISSSTCICNQSQLHTKSKIECSANHNDRLIGVHIWVAPRFIVLSFPRLFWGWAPWECISNVGEHLPEIFKA